MSTPALPPGFEIDAAPPPLPPGFEMDGAAPRSTPPLSDSRGRIQPEPEPFDPLKTRVGALKAAGSAALRGGAQILDMLNPLPIAAEVLSYLGNRTRLRATLPESSDPDMRNRQASRYAQEIAKEHAKALGAGIFEELANEFSPADPNFINDAMDKIGKMTVSIGDAYESKSKGAVTSEDVQQAFNALMFGGLSKVASAHAQSKRKAPLAEAVVEPEIVPPASTKPSTQPTQPERGSDASLRAEREVEGGLSEFGKAMREVDEVRTAEQRAYSLMQKGASKKEVEAAISSAGKDSPLAQALAAIRARREQVASAESGFEVDGKPADIVEPSQWKAGPASFPEELPQIGKAPGMSLKSLGLTTAGAAALAYAYGDSFDRETAQAIIPFAVLAAMPDSTSLGTIRNSAKNSLKTLDRLPDKPTISREQIQQQLNRADVSKAEKDVFATALEGAGDRLTAKELVERIRGATQDFELKAQEIDDFADYGLDSIDRNTHSGKGIFDGYRRENLYAEPNTHGDRWIVSAPGFEGARSFAMSEVRTAQEAVSRAWDEAQKAKEVTPSRTTIYQSPISLGDANHFGDPNYFAHTRSFDEGGVRHVVEIQSDLAQKAKKTLTAEERAKLEARAPIANRLALLAEEAHKAVQDVRSSVKDIADAADRYIGGFDPEVQFDVKLRVGHKIWEFIRESPTGQKFYNEVYPLAENGDFDAVYDAAVAANREAARTRRIDRSDLSVINSALEEGFYHENRRFGLENAEIISKLKNSASSSVEPMLKNWYRRIIDEEIGEAAKDAGDSSTIRFATADTVAKVEGWPTSEQTIRILREDIATKERLAAQSPDFAYKLEEAEPLRKRLAELEARGPLLSRNHQSIYDRYRGDVEKYLRGLGGKPVTDAQGHTWLEVLLPEAPQGGRIAPPKMFGGTDQRMLNALAAAGIGAVAANWLAQPENRDLAMAIGAVAAGGVTLLSSKVPAIAEAAATAAKGLDYGLGSLSTRIGAISQPIKRRLDQFELESLRGTYNSVDRIKDFANGFVKLPLAIQERLKPLILTNSPLAIQRELRRYPELAAAWTQARAELDRLGREMKGAGLIKELLPDYFPRIVKDVEALRAHLGVEHRTGLDNALAQAATKAGRPLDEVERSIVINKYLERREGLAAGKPSFTKPRRVGEVDMELAQFYESPEVSLTKYTQRASTAIARAKFFGRDLVRNLETGLVDIGASVGAMVDKELAAGRINAEQFIDLDGMLKSRFGPGERSGWSGFNDMKALTQVGLLGHLPNAMVQIGDSVVAAAAHGILPTIRAMQSIVTRQPSRVTARDFGLVDHLAEEFAGTTRVKKIVDAGFKYSGFRTVDLFGKGVVLNAALTKNRGLAKTAKGQAALDGKWSGYFGDDMAALKGDLAAGRRTALVDELLFRELADLQPITRSEMAQMYLDHPNTIRPLFTLKTFMLKQADIVRREVVQNFRAGKTRLATQQALKFGLAMGIGGASGDFIRNWMLNRETDDLTWGTIAANAFKVYGLSDYLREKAQKEGPIDAFLDGYIGWPPASVMDDIITLDPKAIQYLPVGGRMLYNYLPVEDGGLTGAEQANIRRQRTADRRERDADPIIRQERRERALDRAN